jgi:hypothetical protein
MSNNPNSPNNFNPDLGPHGSRDGMFSHEYDNYDDPMPFPNGGVPPQEVLNFHRASDVDASGFAQHHTLGPRHNQSSPGDHIHDGKTSPLLSSITTLQAQMATKVATTQIINKTAVCTTLMNLTSSTEVDVTGATFTFTTTATAATCNVSVTFDFQCNTASAGNIAIGSLNVDGTDQPRQALFDMNSAGARDTVAQHYQFTVAAGNHTIKLRAALLATAGSTAVGTNHTNVNLICFDM